MIVVDLAPARVHAPATVAPGPTSLWMRRLGWASIAALFARLAAYTVALNGRWP